MPKIDVDSLKFILQRNEPDVRKVADIMNEVQMQIQAEEEEKANKPPAVKKQFAVLLADHDGSLAQRDITGWVVQVPEEESPGTAPARIHEAAHAFNASPKGRKMPVKTMGEACEVVTQKFLKEQNVWVKTKTPIEAIAVKNDLPRDTSE